MNCSPKSAHRNAWDRDRDQHGSFQVQDTQLIVESRTWRHCTPLQAFSPAHRGSLGLYEGSATQSGGQLVAGGCQTTREPICAGCAARHSGCAYSRLGSTAKHLRACRAAQATDRGNYFGARAALVATERSQRCCRLALSRKLCPLGLADPTAQAAAMPRLGRQLFARPPWPLTWLTHARRPACFFPPWLSAALRELRSAR